MPAAIQVQGLAKRFGPVVALDGVDLTIAQGEFFGLLGPNGAGKTTLISIIGGLARADRGSARVMGHDTISQYRAARRALGVVPQELTFDPFFTVRETLRIQAGYFGIHRDGGWIDEIMHHLDLTAKADANMRSLSGGMKRRVLVAQALVHRPPVIVLDEPTAGVDVELRLSLWRFIRRLNADGHTIVLTTHYLEEAESLCGRVAMMKSGRIVAMDRTADLIRRHHSLYLRVGIGDGPLPIELQPRCAASEGNVHTLSLDGYEQVEGVLSVLRAASCEVIELELVQPDLEEVFVQIMRGAAGVPIGPVRAVASA